MQDRFRFRIWATTKKKMHYDDFVVTSTGYIAPIDDDVYCYFDQTDLETDKKCKIMQCTGLKDKNGKLIYEGDIVRWILPRKDKDVDEDYTIVWNDEHCNFLCKKIETGELYDIFSQPKLRAKVIGNIHENKELMG